MIGCIDVEFSPSRDIVPKILGIIADEGYTLRALRLVPCPSAKRSTLKIDIGICGSTPEICSLADQLLMLEETIAVIHAATVGAAP